MAFNDLSSSEQGVLIFISSPLADLLYVISHSGSLAFTMLPFSLHNTFRIFKG